MIRIDFCASKESASVKKFCINNSIKRWFDNKFLDSAEKCCKFTAKYFNINVRLAQLGQNNNVRIEVSASYKTICISCHLKNFKKT